jgi:bis(5'-nucleosidyl)-tetraphosphatase
MSEPNNNSTTQNPVGRFMVAVGAVIELEETGKILLNKRSSQLDWHPGEWEIMYGRIDQHEGPIPGLKREIREETGINDIEIHDILRVWHIYRGQQQTAINELIGITYYVTTKTEQIQISSEHEDYGWFDPQEAAKLVKVEGIRTDVLNYIQKVQK